MSAHSNVYSSMQTCETSPARLNPHSTGTVNLVDVSDTTKLQNQLNRAEHTSTGEWGPMQPFEVELLPVLPLTEDLLPAYIYEYVSHHAERLDNAPVEYAAIAVLISAAAMIGNSYSIQPKEYDSSWKVPCVVWGIAIGMPSDMKSPSLKAGASLIEHAQKKVINAHNNIEQLRYELIQMTAEAKKQSLKQKALKASEDGNELMALQLMGEAQMVETEAPLVRNVMITDFTKAALAQRFLANPNGLLLFRDELSGLIAVLNSQGGDELRSFLLQTFDASGSYTIDRAKFGSIVLNDMNMSVLGGLQPSLLRPILAERSSGAKDDGFIERFSMSVMPDSFAVYTDIAPNETLILGLKKVFETLAELAYLECTEILRFNSDAQTLWTTWATHLRESINQSTPQEKTVLGKQAALCAKISLLLHILNEAKAHVDKESADTECSADTQFLPAPEVPVETLQMAIKLTELLESHSRRIQAFFQTEMEISPGQLLLDNIKAFDQPFSLREVARKGWKGLSNKENIIKAFDELVARNYLRRVEVPGQNGRALERYEVNPLFS